MCGIVGKYNFSSGEPVSEALIEAMCRSLMHRGPDAGGVYVDGAIGLGHRRLSILDLSELGRQPMSGRDATLWITFNGEIYNFQELRSGLIKKGYSFRSNCDTEVLLCLYEEYGEELLKLARGMFAFAIWDQKRSRLFLARDRIGKKPLYYYYDNKRIIFASEIKAILEDCSVEKEIDRSAVYDYFKYLYVPDPKTIYKNINKLEPGHYLICDREGVTDKEYWDIEFSPDYSRSSSDFQDELLAVLEESVKLRMISDVPLGAFLSGGIDSSCVVALMARQQDRPVTTCSIGFDSEAYDEIAYSRTVAQKFKSDHHEFTVKQKARDILGYLASIFDEPFADPSSVPTYYVSKLAREKVTVALSGDGGDESFAGYDKYYLENIENGIRRKIPSGIRSLLFPSLARWMASGDNVLLRKGSTLLNALGVESDYGYYLTNTHIDDTLWNDLITPELKNELGDYDPFRHTQRYYSKAKADDHLSRALYTDLKTYLPGDILVKVDRMSMANSLEVRSPFLDHHIIELAARMPIQLKFRKGEKKHILKKAFEGILPPEIMYRKKMGFCVPLADWLRGELKDFAWRYLFSTESGLSRFFRKEPLRVVWEKHQSGKRDYGTVLWSLLMFALWHEKCLGGCSPRD